MSRVITLVEQEGGEPLESSLEALNFARDAAARLEATLEAVVFGNEGAAVADELGTHGVGAVHAVIPESGFAYAPAVWGEVLADIGGGDQTAAIIGPGSDRGQEVLAHAGAVLGQPMAANCLSIEAVDEDFTITRQRWGGSLVERARVAGEPPLLSAAPHEHAIEPAETAVEPTVDEVRADLGDSQVAVDRFEESEEEGVPLSEARVVVSGGRGVGSAEDFDQLEELADLLGGAVGASRAAVNEGWRPHDDQVGLTGNKISPDIYIACGISGAVQHMVGCKGADNIMAINTDPDAAIIQQGEYAVIGDLHEVVPALNEAIRDVE
ncbi:MAG: electron transfer flavoprotein subunit alpha/FixB family protein [Salinirussus sp.]